TNPLPPGTHRLPGTIGGRPFHWQVTSPGGHEQLFVIASRQKLPGLERQLETMAPTEPGRPIECKRLESGPAPVMRGIGGSTAGSEPTAEQNAVAQLLRALDASSVPSTDVVLRRISLRNP